MRLRTKANPDCAAQRAEAGAAYTIWEVVVAVGVFSILALSVVTGIGSGVFAVRLARENARATQIMLEKIETIRLYTWDQINSNGFIPATFTEAYDPQLPGTNGLVYSGTFSITPAVMNASYTNDVRLITVRVLWGTGDVQRQREVSTYFSRYGLQDYIY